MPDLDLSGQLWEIDARPLAAVLGISPDGLFEEIDLTAICRLQKYYCYVLWPSSRERRAAMLAWCWATNLARVLPGLRADAAEARRDPLYSWLHDQMLRATRECMTQALEIDGGWSALCDAIPQKEIEDAERNANIAGQILGAIEAMVHHGTDRPSVNKAEYMIEKTARVGRTTIRAAWASHKSVAHLRLALKAADKMIRDADDTEREVNTILALARQLQLSAIARGNLHAQEMWTVPATLDLPACESVRWRLSDDMIEILPGYRAPQRSRCVALAH